MMLHEIYDELEQENKNNIRMVFISKSGKASSLKYQMYNIPIDNKIKECLYDFLKSKLKEYCRKKLFEKKYKVINSD